MFGGVGFLQSSGNVAHVKGPGVGQDQVQLGIKVGPTTLAYVNEQDRRQKIHLLPQEIVVRGVGQSLETLDKDPVNFLDVGGGDG